MEFRSFAALLAYLQPFSYALVRLRSYPALPTIQPFSSSLLHCWWDINYPCISPNSERAHRGLSLQATRASPSPAALPNEICWNYATNRDHQHSSTGKNPATLNDQ